MTIKQIDVAQDFSKYPAGRYRGDGDFSAENFRETFLLPALQNIGYEKVVVKLDNVAGYSSSFLEETFGGLVRSNKITKEEILKKLSLESEDANLLSEIEQYIREA